VTNEKAQIKIVSKKTRISSGPSQNSQHQIQTPESGHAEARRD
jgi:hypothetical protein